jgi:hypothetical protein
MVQFRMATTISAIRPAHAVALCSRETTFDVWTEEPKLYRMAAKLDCLP